jgi:hydrogenase maturation protease
MRYALPAPNPAPVTLVGLGSPWGDDRVGWCVADAVARRLRGTRGAAQARVVKLDRPGIGLLDEIAECPRVFLVDAADSGAVAGTLHSIPLDALSAAPWGAPNPTPGTLLGAASTHGIGVAETLALGRGLGVLPAELRLYLVSIDPCRTRHSDRDLSPAVAAAVGPLMAIIYRRLRGCGASEVAANPSKVRHGRGLRDSKAPTGPCRPGTRYRSETTAHRSTKRPR